MYCVHDRLADQCETCVLAHNVERGRVAIGPSPTFLVRVAVDGNTLVDRSADLGDGITTFVAAGDLVPLGLEDLPRRPRSGIIAEPVASRRRPAVAKTTEAVPDAAPAPCP